MCHSQCKHPCFPEIPENSQIVAKTDFYLQFALASKNPPQDPRVELSLTDYVTVQTKAIYCQFVNGGDLEQRSEAGTGVKSLIRGR